MSNRKYYKYQDIEPFGTTYVETEDDHALRQITEAGDDYIASNIRHPIEAFVLGEGPGNYDEAEEAIPIERAEFLEVWDAHLARYQSVWETVKVWYPLGSTMQGAIICFLPQGVLVDLGQGATAIADYERCLASTEPRWMYPRHKITATVSGYDEENQWIILTEPQVLEATLVLQLH